MGLMKTCDTSVNEFIEEKLALTNYCRSTSIHGLKYIVSDDCEWFERFLWVLLFLAGICFSSYFCFLMWQKWEDSPVLVSLDTNHYPLKNIAFPAVTICNANKVSASRLTGLLSYLTSKDVRFRNITFDQLRTSMRFIHKLTRPNDRDKNEMKHLQKVFKAQNITALDLFQILKKVSPATNEPSLTNMIENCTWLGIPETCNKKLSFLPTDEGICTTFNYGANYSDPLLEFNVSISKKELRTGSNGFRAGLSITLNANVEDYATTTAKFYGFKVLIHPPEEFPDVEDRGFVISPGVETFAAVKVTVTSSTKEISSRVPQSKRWCRAPEENDLKFVSQYSRSACVINCTTELILRDCKCRPYFLRADPEIPLCELEAYICVSEVYDLIRQDEDKFCGGCLPSCTDIRYEPEISYATFAGPLFNQSQVFKRLATKLNINLTTDTDVIKRYLKTNFAVLHVYYKERTGTHYSTGVRYGMEDFISAMGGLMGLGVGMSFISVIEFLYFICLRKIVTSFRRRF